MIEVKSTFQNRPCYRYILASDKLPTYQDLNEKSFAKVKLFNPTGAGTWYIASYNPETATAFGVADLGYGPEMGDICLSELVEYRGSFNLPIERDLHFIATPLESLMQL